MNSKDIEELKGSLLSHKKSWKTLDIGVYTEGNWMVFYDRVEMTPLSSPRPKARRRPKTISNQPMIIHNNEDSEEIDPFAPLNINYQEFRPRRVLTARKPVFHRTVCNDCDLFAPDIEKQQKPSPFKNRLPFPSKYSTILARNKQQQDLPTVRKPSIDKSQRLFESSVKRKKKVSVWPPDPNDL